MLSIGTLMAYTMVAIAVLVTRYTPGVQSVTLDKNGTNDKTNKWLKNICCRPAGETEGEDEMLPEVSYQQVQSNDEESPSQHKGTRRANKLSSSRWYICADSIHNGINNLFNSCSFTIGSRRGLEYPSLLHFWLNDCCLSDVYLEAT